MHYWQNYSSLGDPFWMMGTFFIPITIGLILIGALIALKGYALWYAARRNEKAWFVALLIVNTMGLLELAYLAFVVKKWSSPKTSDTTTVTPIKPEEK